MACVAEASSTVTSGRTGAGSSAAGADSISVGLLCGCRLGRDLSLGGRNLSGLGLGGLRLLGNLFLGSVGRLGLGLHRRDKSGRHTIELAHAGKRTLNVLGAGLGHSRHMALGGLGTRLALGIGLTRSVGPAVTVPVVDVCHTWPPFLSLPLSAFPIHDTPPRTKKTAPKDRLSHRFTVCAAGSVQVGTSRDDQECSECAGTR